MDALLKKFDYKYMPYENDFLQRELRSLFPDHLVTDEGNRLILHEVVESDILKLKRLTYISSFVYLENEYYTDQYMLEHGTSLNYKRQNTRYATHGLHEYKGKYNPQIVRAIINYFGLTAGDKVLDPFCGSGTTQVECALSGIESTGTDINPLAVEISNLKISALTLDCNAAKLHLSKLYALLINMDSDSNHSLDSARLEYLLRWIPKETLFALEKVRNYSQTINSAVGMLFVLSASNLIREYSLQEPLDLRIRRRISPLPEKKFRDAWKELVAHQLTCIELFQRNLHTRPANGCALNVDIRKTNELETGFNAAITSPPYATALPYIDTQRISLVWLGLCDPTEIMSLESSLIGSRELYHINKDKLYDKMFRNDNNLPTNVYNLILELQNNLSPDDGFRKRAVPLLLYRYFSDMKQMFERVHPLLNERAKYALVVGNNKTTIGGKTTVIDTPQLLSAIATNCGWTTEELIPLQTYQRYGLNSKNAINQETLVILKKSLLNNAKSPINASKTRRNVLY